MDISSVFSQYSTNEIEAIEYERKRQQSQNSTTSSRGDTISISAEGKTLAEQMIQARTGAADSADDQGAETGLGGDASGSSQTAPTSPSGGGGGGSSGSSNDDTIKEIEAKINALTSQLASIVSSGDSDGQAAKISAVEGQINALTQQLNELKSSAEA